MSYQALLFCPDERLARVVTQVFSELEFTVEPVNEPFAAVKKLMAQRYDAIVVDCENDPNATLIFKSARNSSSNQSSLALALVEGQAGVAKAYRIGANLVLTKPINVEQAKGTLRVARGLLRKNLDAAATSPAVPAKVAPAPAAAPIKPAIQNVEATPPQSTYELPEFESAPPVIAASAPVVSSPVAAPALEGKSKVWAEHDSSGRNTLPSSLFEAVEPSAPAPIKSAGSAPTSTGAASAPAPAREIAVPVEAKPAAAPPVEHKEVSVPTFGATIGSSPSFGALDDRDAEESGGSKKLMIIAAVVIVAAALGFFGWTKISKSSSQIPSVATHEAPVSTASPMPKNVAPSAPVSAPAASAGQPAAPTSSKPSANVGAPSIAITPEPEVVTKKIAPAIVVKSPARVQQQSEDSAPQVPNPLAVAAPNDKKLSSLVSSAPASAPTPTLATVKISQGVSQGLLIKRVQPRYPQNALAMRIQGAVQMEATINKEGNIINLRVANGDAVLSRAAVEAVKQWRYKPYYLNGEPVEIETQITVNFKLPN
jgi:protein TonB